MVDGDRRQSAVGDRFPGGVFAHKEIPAPPGSGSWRSKQVTAIGRVKLPSGGFKHGVHMAL
jgi:hypothetical protein